MPDEFPRVYEPVRLLRYVLELRVLLGRVYVSVFLREYELPPLTAPLLRLLLRVPTTLPPEVPERRTLCPILEWVGREELTP